METVLMNARRQFSRNMTVVRDGNALTLINSIRLDGAGLAQLEALGRVAHVVKIGSLHGRDDAFYAAHYGARFWAAPGVVHEHGLDADREMPFAGCNVSAFARLRISFASRSCHFGTRFVPLPLRPLGTGSALRRIARICILIGPRPK
jgi:hypothetical protein